MTVLEVLQVPLPKPKEATCTIRVLKSLWTYEKPPSVNGAHLCANSLLQVHLVLVLCEVAVGLCMY